MERARDGKPRSPLASAWALSEAGPKGEAWAWQDAKTRTPSPRLDLRQVRDCPSTPSSQAHSMASSRGPRRAEQLAQEWGVPLTTAKLMAAKQTRKRRSDIPQGLPSARAARPLARSGSDPRPAAETTRGPRPLDRRKAPAPQKAQDSVREFLAQQREAVPDPLEFSSSTPNRKLQQLARGSSRASSRPPTS